MINALTLCYVACFQCCAIPATVRIIKRGSSKDLSIWREVLLIVGASLQLIVMAKTGAAWQVILSPIATLINLSVLLVVILWFRKWG